MRKVLLRSNSDVSTSKLPMVTAQWSKLLNGVNKDDRVYYHEAETLYCRPGYTQKYYVSLKCHTMISKTWLVIVITCHINMGWVKYMAQSSLARA